MLYTQSLFRERNRKQKWVTSKVVNLTGALDCFGTENERLSALLRSAGKLDNQKFMAFGLNNFNTSR